MRTAVHDTTVKFRANETLLLAAKEKARADGMSLAELLRQAMRREVKETA